jgi:hypothetical protein
MDNDTELFLVRLTFVLILCAVGFCVQIYYFWVLIYYFWVLIYYFDFVRLTYVLILSALGSIVLQMKYLNEALMHFGVCVCVCMYMYTHTHTRKYV